MTPAQLKEAVRGLPLTHAQIAERIGVTTGHLRNCLYGQRNLSQPALLMLAQLQRDKPPQASCDDAKN